MGLIMMTIRKGKRVEHTISGLHGTVQAKRADRALVKWDNTGYVDRHKIHYLKIIGDVTNGQ